MNVLTAHMVTIYIISEFGGHEPVAMDLPKCFRNLRFREVTPPNQAPNQPLLFFSYIATNNNIPSLG